MIGKMMRMRKMLEKLDRLTVLKMTTVKEMMRQLKIVKKTEA